MKNIVFISGSLRQDSWNTKLLQAFATELPEEVSVSWANIEWPLFNEDLEAADFPAAVRETKDAIESADAVVIATPEYNRAMTGVLKNAIDWISRPYGENSFAGKRVLVMSASLGGVAGACAYYNVVQSLTHLSAAIVADTEFMLGNAPEHFAADGSVDDATKAHIQDAVQKLLG